SRNRPPLSRIGVLLDDQPFDGHVLRLAADCERQMSQLDFLPGWIGTESYFLSLSVVEPGVLREVAFRRYPIEPYIIDENLLGHPAALRIPPTSTPFLSLQDDARIDPHSSGINEVGEQARTIEDRTRLPEDVLAFSGHDRLLPVLSRADHHDPSDRSLI